MNNTNHLTGKVLGTCKLERLIGRGGMSVVYLAHQNRPMRHVAVKILLPNAPVGSSLHNEFLARFQYEADIIAKLEHAHIIPIFECDEQEGIAYIVMPYLTGGSLREVLVRRGPLSLQETLTYIEQAAQALDYAHRQGVIHQDLKPGNFLLHADGRLVLADFGIARIIQGISNFLHSNLTNPGILLGTPEYMAPEMVLGGQIDARTDIYELGIMLFQMLSGDVPFKGRTAFEVIEKHLEQLPPLLHQPAVDTVIRKATAKKPGDRYESAGAFAQALRSAITGLTNPSHTKPSQGLYITTTTPTFETIETPLVGPKRVSEPFQFIHETMQLLKNLEKRARSFFQRSEQFHTAISPSQPLSPGSPPTVLFPESQVSDDFLKDFFISYSRIDLAWAKWITAQLVKAGYSSILPPWGIRTDSNFEIEMQKATAKARRVILVLSPTYIKMLSTQSTSIDTLRKNVIDEKSTLLPIHVQESGDEFRKFLETIDYIDIVGENEATASAMLLAGVRSGGIELTTPVVFPGNTVDTSSPFPGSSTSSEALQLAPGASAWLALQQQGIAQLEADENVLIEVKSSTAPSSTVRLSGIKGLEVFFSYSHKDEEMRHELEIYLSNLKRQRSIIGWYDGEIGAGSEWAQEIDNHLSQAHIILLLVSQDFIASDYCYNKEMMRALERHEKGEAFVIPIILRPANWEVLPFGKIQALPTGAKPITLWPNRDEAFLNVARGVQKVVDRITRNTLHT